MKITELNFLKKEHEKAAIILLCIVWIMTLYFTQYHTGMLYKILYVCFTTFGAWFVFFETEKLERLLLGNFTKVIFGIIFIFLFINFDFIKISKDTFYIIGGLFAFWYGYKKYEKDKTIKHLENLFNNTYDIDIVNKAIKLELMYNQHQKGIISNDIWKYIEKSFWSNFSSDIDKYIETHIDIEIKKIVKNCEKMKGDKTDYLEKKKKKTTNDISENLGKIFKNLISGTNTKYNQYLIKQIKTITVKDSKKTSDIILSQLLKVIKN